MDIPSDCNKLSCSVNKVLEPFGFECHPFLTGWYNQLGIFHEIFPHILLKKYYPIYEVININVYRLIGL